MAKNGKNGRGRPTKLNKALQQRFADCLASGLTRQGACARIGVPVRTFYFWLEKGESDHAPYDEFLQAIKQAESECMNRWVKAIEGHADSCWTAAAWLLERRFPDEWGKRDRVQADVSGGLKVQIEWSERNGDSGSEPE